MHARDYGESLLLSVDEDLTSLPTVWVVLRRPDGSTVTKTDANAVTVVTATRPAVVTCLIQPGDLTTPGTYEAQVFMQFDGLVTKGVASDPIAFVVEPSLHVPPWTAPTSV